MTAGQERLLKIISCLGSIKWEDAQAKIRVALIKARLVQTDDSGNLILTETGKFRVELMNTKTK